MTLISAYTTFYIRSSDQTDSFKSHGNYVASKNVEAPWVEYLETEIVDKMPGLRDDSEVINTVKVMLQAPDSDHDAAYKATDHIRQFYHELSREDECAWKEKAFRPST